MSDNIVLSASIRANLLSLQGTNSLMDKTQLNLSTGKKVNSALDNAVSFFTAKSLTDRASDLNSLLDSMGQSISSLNQANTSATSLTKLVDQANSIANQARDALAKGTQEARVAGTEDLRNVTDVSALAGATADSELRFTVVDKNGNSIDTNSSTVGIQAFSGAAGTVAFDAGDTIDDLVAKINALDANAASPILEAKLNDSGKLEIKALNGARVSVSFVSDATAGNIYDAANTTANLQLAGSLGFGDVAEAVLNGATAATDKDTRMTLTSSSSLTSTTLYKSGAVAKASDLLQDLFTDTTSTSALVSAHGAGDKIYIGVNNGTSKSYSIDNLSVEGLISKVNGDFQGVIEASFDESTGKLNIRATGASVSTIEFGVDGATAALTERFGFGVQAGVVATTASTKSFESIRLGSAAADLATFESDYNKIRSQVDALVKDAGYRGTNLLNGDDLLTVFNEDRSTSITTKGQVLTSAGLGLNAANFGNAGSVESALSEVRGATSALRTFSASLANDLNVIQTREGFTKQTINTLQAGADKLTIADPNEEGAKMLALQTRQQLAVSALSLASQAQQSVLSLLR